MEGTTVTIATLMAGVTDVFGTAIDMVGDVATTVASTPMLLLFASIPLVGLGVGLFKRLLNVN